MGPSRSSARICHLSQSLTIWERKNRYPRGCEKAEKRSWLLAALAPHQPKGAAPLQIISLTSEEGFSKKSFIVSDTRGKSDHELGIHIILPLSETGLKQSAVLKIKTKISLQSEGH